MTCTCQQCGIKYKVDLIVDDDIWEKIKPHNKTNSEGLLCGSCIMRNIEKINKYNAFKMTKI